jgi:hypothetical protein
MQFDLAEHPIGEQAPLAVQEGDRRLVAGSFDAENYHGRFERLSPNALA